MFRFPHHLQERLHHARLEVCARQFADMLQRPGARPGRAVGAVRRQRIVDVHDAEDAGAERDLFAFEAARVAAAVPFLVVAVGDVERPLQVGDRLEHLPGVGGMHVHERPLVVGQRVGLEQDAVGDAHLADIMQQRPAPDLDQLPGPDAHPFRQPDGHPGHALGVALRLLVAQVERRGPAFEGRVIGFGQVLVRALQVGEQGGVVDGDGGLPGQRLEEF